MSGSSNLQAGYTRGYPPHQIFPVPQTPRRDASGLGGRDGNGRRVAFVTPDENKRGQLAVLSLDGGDLPADGAPQPYKKTDFVPNIGTAPDSTDDRRGSLGRDASLAQPLGGAVSCRM